MPWLPGIAECEQTSLTCKVVSALLKVGVRGNFGGDTLSSNFDLRMGYLNHQWGLWDISFFSNGVVTLLGWDDNSRGLLVLMLLRVFKVKNRSFELRVFVTMTCHIKTKLTNRINYSKMKVI